MRVLWLSPWMRPLARVQAEALAALGHQVLLVTSDNHPESGAARGYELVLRPRPKDPSTWAPFARGLRFTRSFAADVVVTELVRDPRWLALAGRTPRVAVVHDDRPHDPGEQRPAWERVLFDRWAAHAAVTVTFSDHVAGALRHPVSGPVEVVPLTSDVADILVGPPVPAADRRDMVVFGRLNPYKNLAVTFEAWRRHVAGPGWRGDDLLVIGAGELPGPLPPHARRLAGDFTYAQTLPVLARAKASLVHYRQASQSGVQVLSLQLGVTPVVSPVGALPEFQPPGEQPVGVDDPAGLAAALDRLADPGVAAARGALARRHYDTHFAADRVALRWTELLTTAAGRGPKQRPSRRAATSVFPEGRTF